MKQHAHITRQLIVKQWSVNTTKRGTLLVSSCITSIFLFKLQSGLVHRYEIINKGSLPFDEEMTGYHLRAIPCGDSVRLILYE